LIQKGSATKDAGASLTLAQLMAGSSPGTGCIMSGLEPRIAPMDQDPSLSNMHFFLSVAAAVGTAGASPPAASSAWPLAAATRQISKACSSSLHILDAI